MNDIELPSGFRFAGRAIGIKASGRPDLALIAAEQGKFLTAAGVYTENTVRAASIDWNRERTPSARIAALAVNSGNANACTGTRGIADNEAFAAAVAAPLGARAREILILSTGVIGVPLPMPVIVTGAGQAAAQLRADAAGFDEASRAILTTDQFPKTAGRATHLSSGTGRLAGICKGAGMIGPRMATMLAAIVTDIALTPEQAAAAVRKAADHSFNRISVEGHTSTNDAVVLLSSGAGPAVEQKDDLHQFEHDLTEMCIELARQIPADGEGATHVIAITVRGAAHDQDADRVARSIALSNLVKTAVTGHDPNWGRIVSAAGYSGAELAPERMALQINGHPVFAAGQPVPFDESIVSQSMAAGRDVQIELDCGVGPGEAHHWTSDLTHEYIRINSEYRT